MMSWVPAIENFQNILVQFRFSLEFTKQRKEKAMDNKQREIRQDHRNYELKTSKQTFRFKMFACRYHPYTISVAHSKLLLADLTL